MQELDQTQELIQMLKERLNEKDETIATLQATIKNLEATVKMLQENAVDLKATIANLTETLNEFKRKFFGISSEKSKKKQTDEPVCEEASEQESGIRKDGFTRMRRPRIGCFMRRRSWHFLTGRCMDITQKMEAALHLSSLQSGCSG